MATIHCAGYIFNSNFDSGNLAKVECIPKHESVVVPVHRHGKDVPEIPDVEFNIWTRPDCMGTEFENGNRTWFYFGVKGYKPSVLMKLNLVDLNRQAKMYSQGMAPVFKTIPGRPNWERIRDKPTYTVIENIFTLSFKFKTPENADTIMYFAFTYPYTYTDLQNSLLLIDQKFLSMDKLCTPPTDDIYYVRELVCKSLEGRRVDLITISSLLNITSEREKRLKFLFPHEEEPRPFKFKNKKIIFISARVHPGETPSSFVFNGLLNFLLRKDDPIAQQLRRQYVFKMIPFLNPDGVAKGHYRTDTRGVNLNRMYLEPTLAEHPSVYAARKLLLYYHFGEDDDDEYKSNITNSELLSKKALPLSETSDTTKEPHKYSSENKMAEGVQILSLEEKESKSKFISADDTSSTQCSSCHELFVASNLDSDSLSIDHLPRIYCPKCNVEQKDSRLFMYIDMHGHASKKGIFMYGNHFEDMDKNVECMLLPKILSLNNHNFHFNACNFTERNMYLRDRRDGMSREGSGRVAVLKLTGLVKSYTLECNYNSGRMVNVLPPMVKDVSKQMHCLPVPPKYTPHIFEEVGAAIAISILDLTGQNPFSRIPNSEFHSLSGLREWLRVNYYNEMGVHPKAPRPKTTIQTSVKPRPRTMRNLAVKRRATTSKLINRKAVTKTGPIPIERKENIVVQSRDPNTINSSQSVCYSASSSCSRIFNRTTKTKGLSIRKTAKNQRNKINAKQVSNRSCQTSNTSLNLDIIEKAESEPNSPTGTGSATQIKRKESPKRAKVTNDGAHAHAQHNDRLKLREICFIKENMTKKLIAKFSSSDSAQDIDDDDDLVVAWDPSYSPKVLSKFHSRTNLAGNKIDSTFDNPEPSCS